MKEKVIIFLKSHSIPFVMIAICANICALLFFAGQAQAAEYQGSYLGGSIGTSYNSIQIESDTTSGSTNAQEGFLSYWAGYGMTRENIYYGIEIGFFINDTKDSDNISEQYSPVLRVGLINSEIFFDELLLYGVTGWQASDVRYKNNSDVFYGPRFGIGFEHQIQKRIYTNQEKSKIFFRGEINYIHYSEKELSNTSKDTTLNPGSTNIQFGLGFRF